MKRFLAGLLVLALAAGCGATNPSGNGANGADIELAAANVAHLAGTPQDAANAAAAVNTFGLALYGRVAAADKAGNLVLSPASIALALAMARAGARGQTATEMDAVLRSLGSDDHAAWLAALDSALNSRTGQFQDMSGKPQDVTLRIVNAPFAQRGFALQPAYLDALAARFGAGLRLVDYVNATEAARQAINAWVSVQTEQRIKELLAGGDLDTLTRLVLVNAIYLKAAWQTPFTVEATAPAPFTRIDGSTVDVPMMNGGGELPYAAGDGWRAVELPYVGGKLSMLVIVPDDLAAFEGALDDKVLGTITGALATNQVNLGLPKFGAESRVELAPVLAALGMPTAFSDAADFSGITTQEPLLVSAVIHQANIDVDEKGTTAAAATAVVMRASAMPAQPITLTVDRPFLFALRDVDTGAVLFLGRIADPSAAAAK
jgi:serpin B